MEKEDPLSYYKIDTPFDFFFFPLWKVQAADTTRYEDDGELVEGKVHETS